MALNMGRTTANSLTTLNAPGTRYRKDNINRNGRANRFRRNDSSQSPYTQEHIENDIRNKLAEPMSVAATYAMSQKALDRSQKYKHVLKS